MMRYGFAVALMLSWVPMGPSNGQETSVSIVSEDVQEIARDLQIAQQLGIQWDAASPEQVGSYMGFLAAVEVAAYTLAEERGKSEPEVADYATAFSLYCIWPPNKPPTARDLRPHLYAALYDEDLRADIRRAIGPGAYAISGEIAEELAEITPGGLYSALTKGVIDFPYDAFPLNLEEYNAEIFDFSLIDEPE